MAGANQSACAERSHAWMTPFAGAATTGNASGRGFDSTTAGIAGGADRTFDQGITIGFAGQYSQDRITAARFTTARDTSRAQLTSYHLGIYSRIPVGDLKLDAAAVYATNTSTATRDTPVGAGDARSSPSGHGAGAALQVSYDLLGGDISPYAGLRLFNYSRQGATETSPTPIGLAIHAASLTSIRADAGVRLQHSYQLGTMKLTPQIWLGLEQEFGSTRNATTGSLAFIQSADFSVAPKAIDRTLAAAEIRLGADVTDNFQLYLDLNGRAGTTTKQGTAIFGGQLRF
jgi:outer membrane autotransporter protein